MPISATAGRFCSGQHGLFFHLYLALLVAVADLRWNGTVAQQPIDSLGDIQVNGHVVPVLNLDHHVKGGRRAPFEDRFLRSAAASLFIAQGHALDARRLDRPGLG